MQEKTLFERTAYDHALFLLLLVGVMVLQVPLSIFSHRCSPSRLSESSCSSTCEGVQCAAIDNEDAAGRPACPDDPCCPDGCRNCPRPCCARMPIAFQQLRTELPPLQSAPVLTIAPESIPARRLVPIFHPPRD